ncbi:unnamed protein product [Pleuronectes platessa]|uniref:Uncharacterized protein n=1 Tax=Pleuronectes platessa TaxID=8262 RepID=A0A9N7ZCS2_PLEPL|nr:unnamed protein product [Pleuronectes platessa]
MRFRVLDGSTDPENIPTYLKWSLRTDRRTTTHSDAQRENTSSRPRLRVQQVHPMPSGPVRRTRRSRDPKPPPRACGSKPSGLRRKVVKIENGCFGGRGLGTQLHNTQTETAPGNTTVTQPGLAGDF